MILPIMSSSLVNHMYFKILRCLGLFQMPENITEDWQIKKSRDEGLSDYWSSLNGLDQKRWYVKEMHQR